MTNALSRREVLATACAVAAGAAANSATFAAAATHAAAARPADEPFGYCFNTSTIRGQKLPLPEVVDLAAKAGYHAIEPWLDEIHNYTKAGGSLPDLRKRIADAGLTVESAIGFASWIVDDDAARAKALEAMKGDMDAVRAIGGKRIAAPPVGATNQSNFDLFKAAARYRALLDLGATMEVTPQLELWGFSKTLSRLGEVAFVAAESGHPSACVLTDVYHIYKGGSDFRGLRLIAGTAMHVMHVNDYPATPPRETIKDADRIFPGDGVAPLATVFRDLQHTGFRGFLSLEVFNASYYQQDPFVVARTGLEHTRNAVRQAFAT